MSYQDRHGSGYCPADKEHGPIPSYQGNETVNPDCHNGRLTPCGFDIGICRLCGSDIGSSREMGLEYP
jgi:hypothetical protein